MSFNHYVIVGNLKADGGTCQHHRVAQRNEVRRSFGSLNSRNSGNCQNITLFQILVGYRRNRVGAHENLASSNRPALRGLLSPDIDHARLALVIKVSQPRHMGSRFV